MPDVTTALSPIQERSVDFYGDQVLAVLVEQAGERQIFVPLRPIAAYLGLNWAAQTRRIRRDDILSEEVASVAVTATEAGGKRDMLCLPLRLLPGWLFGIDASRIRPELKDKIRRYRRECFDVLWRAFQADATARQPGSPTLATLTQVREMGLAIAALAEQQMAQEMRLAAHENRLDTVEQRLDRAAQVVASLQRRIAAGPITEEQAAEISARVKALAEYLSSKEPGKVHYQAIFGELYRQFGVTSYKAIPLDRYGEVMQFLEDWRKAAGG